MDTQTFDLRVDKLTEAIVYLVNGSQNDQNFGETKLVKLLYYADCAAYMQTGEPITGVTYLRYQHGPYPQAWATRKSTMEAAGDVDVILEELGFNVHRHRWTASRSAASGILSPQEEAILDEQLDRFADFNATQIAEYAHQEFGWILTEPGEPIPYDLAGLSDLPLTDEHFNAARRIATNASNRQRAA